MLPVYLHKLWNTTLISPIKIKAKVHSCEIKVNLRNEHPNNSLSDTVYQFLDLMNSDNPLFPHFLKLKITIHSIFVYILKRVFRKKMSAYLGLYFCGGFQTLPNGPSLILTKSPI